MNRMLPIVALAFAAGTASARPIFPEVEPNDSKAQANAVTLSDGDGVSGFSTSGTGTGPDYFRVKNTPRPLGIYRHSMTLSSGAGSLHTAQIRGLNQLDGGPGVGGIAGTTDTLLQSGATVGSTRVVEWYGFGKAEELYYRVSGTANTTTQYTSVLSTTSVTPVSIGTFQAGPITISTMNVTSTDTDFWVYDAALDAIPGYGNDDNSVLGGGTGVGLQSILTRTYAPGVYYLAMTNFNFANNQTSPGDDDFRTGNIMDFPGVALNDSASTTADLTFLIGQAGTPGVMVTGSHGTAFQINWYTFTVVPAPGAAGVLVLGALAWRRRR